MHVPDVLLSGDHARVEAWREAQRLDKTRLRRPDLMRVWRAESSRTE
jgi:tRNA (guanine-N1)-methyltransferase